MTKINLDILNYFELKQIDHSPVKGGGYISLKECPFCSSSDKLYVNIEPENNKVQRDYGFINCFKCGIKGGFEKLFSQLENISPEQAFNQLNPRKKKSKKSFYDIEYEALPSQREVEHHKFNIKRYFNESKRLELPPGVIKVQDHRPAWKYLLSRGLQEKDYSLVDAYTLPYSFIEYLKFLKDESIIDERIYSYFISKKEIRSQIKLTEEQQIITSEIEDYLSMIGRVIFCVRLNQKLVGYVARDYTGKSSLKVKNSRGPLTSDFLCNLDNVKDKKELIIVEGLFDAFATGLDRSIPLLGKQMSESQARFEVLKLIKPESITLVLDPGAEKDAKELSGLLSRFCQCIYIVSLPHILGITDENQSIDVEFLRAHEIPIQRVESGLQIEFKTYDFIRKFYRYLKLYKKYKNKMEAKRAFLQITLHENDDYYKILKLIRKCDNKKKLFEHIKLIKESNYLDINDYGHEAFQEMYQKKRLHNF